jgi:hypothetical protein
VNKQVRAAVFARARNLCECGCGRPAASADHFFGRAKAPELISTVWALAAHCDYMKTFNSPDASWWLSKFIEHCARYGYEEEKKRAEDKKHWIDTKLRGFK